MNGIQHSDLLVAQAFLECLSQKAVSLLRLVNLAFHLSFSFNGFARLENKLRVRKITLIRTWPTGSLSVRSHQRARQLCSWRSLTVLYDCALTTEDLTQSPYRTNTLRFWACQRWSHGGCYTRNFTGRQYRAWSSPARYPDWVVRTCQGVLERHVPRFASNMFGLSGRPGVSCRGSDHCTRFEFRRDSDSRIRSLIYPGVKILKGIHLEQDKKSYF